MAAVVRCQRDGDVIRICTFESRWQRDLAHLWRVAMPHDPISDQRFCTQVLLDRNFDPEGLFLAFDDEYLVGAACAIVQRSAAPMSRASNTAGWIRFFFVAPPARGQGLGARLLSVALDWLNSKDVERIRFSDNLPSYIKPGLNAERYPIASAMLRARGFESVGSAESMARSVSSYQTPEALDELRNSLGASGYQFRPPVCTDLLPLVELAQNTFSDDWADLIRSVACHHDPAKQIVIAVDPAEDLVGWAMYGSYHDTPSRFGPFGVSPTQRGKGIGSVLLDRTLAAMRRADLTDAWFLWVEPDSPAEQLYLRAGFAVQERYDILELKTGSSSP